MLFSMLKTMDPALPGVCKYVCFSILKEQRFCITGCVFSVLEYMDSALPGVCKYVCFSILENTDPA